MSDIKLDDNGDIELTSGLASLITTEERFTQQRLKIKLSLYQGEWYLDLSEGIPYFQTILQKSTPVAVVDSLFRQEILNDPSITEITSFESEVVGGEYRLTFVATTTSGDIVNFSNNS